MKQAIDNLMQHYATVTNGASALFRETLLQICEVHGVGEPEFCDAFARAVAERFAAGQLDADGASFAVDDLHHSAGFVLPTFARNIFDALEYGESSPADIRELLEQEAARNAA